MMLNDVNRVYVHAKSIGEVCVEICDEDREDGEWDVIG